VRLPDRVHTFTGRAEELAWVRQASGDTVVVTQALAGMGGIGKTALAPEYAHSLFYGEHAAHLVWLFSAADRLSLTTAMAALYEQVTGSPTGQDSVVGAERLRNWLEECPYRWLVVFDNADGAGSSTASFPGGERTGAHHLPAQRVATPRCHGAKPRGPGTRRCGPSSDDHRAGAPDTAIPAKPARRPARWRSPKRWDCWRPSAVRRSPSATP